MHKCVCLQDVVSIYLLSFMVVAEIITSYLGFYVAVVTKPSSHNATFMDGNHGNKLL